MTKLTGIFKQIEEHTFSAGKCFLCGCILKNENKTEEHVIPKWLQRHFQLWDQKISLLNGTLIPYRHLTIPCCLQCNNTYLKQFEDKIKATFEGGYEAFEKVDKELLFLWLGKIYFGIMYRELFLNLDRANPEKGTITNPKYIKSFYSHFLFLQGIRKLHSFNDFFPASIYLFKTQKPKDIQEQWDLIDSHITPFISIRMGEIGIVAVLQDCEATYQLRDSLDKHRDISLHPLQFREMTAKILYKKILMNRTPKFFTLQSGETTQTSLMSLQGLSNKPIFDDWNNDDYSLLLSHITGVPLDICQPEKGKVWTWLMDVTGNSIFIPIDN